MDGIRDLGSSGIQNFDKKIPITAGIGECVSFWNDYELKSCSVRHSGMKQRLVNEIPSTYFKMRNTGHGTKCGFILHHALSW